MFCVLCVLCSVDANEKGDPPLCEKGIYTSVCIQREMKWKENTINQLTKRGSREMRTNGQKR